MKKVLFILAIFITSTNIVHASYISYYLIHVGVDHTLKENTRQKEAKQRQARVTALEASNENSTRNLESKYAKIKGSLNKLGLLLDGFIITSEAYPTLRQIIDNQSNIYTECKESPYLIPLSIQSEVEFVDRAQMLIRFLTGLILTYGDINQMEPADRKMLLNHAIKQLDDMNSHSYSLLFNIRSYKRTIALKKAFLESWINEDKQIISEIMSNAKDII